jgi:cobalt-precorrin 5A hydrolase
MIIAGFGCRSGCTAEALLAVLHEAETIAAQRADALAAPAFKRNETGLSEAARLRDLPLHWIDDIAMNAAAPLCPTHSEAALRSTGHASVAEAVALAASGPGGRLILPRLAHRSATCALAISA